MAPKKNYWLMKSEPDVFSYAHLVASKNSTTLWDGVRNYQARNMMRDDMKVGDLVLYYHSNTKPPGVVGLARVCQEGYPDPTQFDEDNKYYDAKSTPEKPRWILVDIEYVGHFDAIVSLETLKQEEDLDGMLVIRKGQRLSVQPVEPHHFRKVCDMAGFDLSSI